MKLINIGLGMGLGIFIGETISILLLGNALDIAQVFSALGWIGLTLLLVHREGYVKK